MARMLKLSVKTRSMVTELKFFEVFLLQEINKMALEIISEILIDIFFQK